MKVYEHVQQFPVKYCDVDFKDEIKASVVLALMEEVACASADELGFGYSYIHPKGYAFMVTNVCLEFIRPIKLGEKIDVKTWPLPPSYVVFGREYQFMSATGETLVNASSRWCLLDRSTGKLLQSKVIENQDYSTYNTAKTIENVQWKIPTFNREEAELRFSMTVANSEYDHNFHVNNTRYADYCLNCFRVAELANRTLKRFSISYVKQCREGDELLFYLKKSESEEETYLAHGFNAQGEMVVQSKITFEKK